MVHEVESLDTIKEGDVLVDFYTTSCHPCKMLAPVLEEISQEFKNVKVAKIEVTKNPLASQLYGVMSVPTIMFMKNSKVKEVHRGFSNKQSLREMIVRHADT
jgi:thioredoxin 1